MAILLVVASLTLGLAWRAGVAQHRMTPVETKVDDDGGVLDSCARASVLVLVSLLGLLALGVMYGNVLGVSASH